VTHSGIALQGFIWIGEIEKAKTRAVKNPDVYCARGMRIIRDDHE
jgi:hypothetical protein